MQIKIGVFSLIERGMGCTEVASHIANYISLAGVSVAVVEPIESSNPIFSTINPTSDKISDHGDGSFHITIPKNAPLQFPKML